MTRRMTEAESAHRHRYVIRPAPSGVGVCSCGERRQYLTQLPRPWLPLTRNGHYVGKRKKEAQHG